MDLKPFADNLVAMGRDHGYILGLKRANDILRWHGFDVTHPARIEIFNAMLEEKPPAAA